MCGIVGYVGKRSSRDVILQGLKKLEYRGYDSCGMATITQQKFEIVKSTKRVEALEKMTEENHFSTIGIGHTRWATHGAPNEKNAHPQVDCKKRFAVVHNGIIENNLELKQKLKDLAVDLKNNVITKEEYDAKVSEAKKFASDIIAVQKAKLSK